MKKIKQVFPSRNYITIDSFGDVEVIFNPVGDGFEGDDKLLFRKGRWAFRVNDFLAGKTMPDGSKEGMGRKVYSLNLVYNEEDGEPIVNTTYVDPTSVIPLDGSLVEVSGSEKLAQEQTVQTLAKDSTVQTLAKEKTVQTLVKESTVRTLKDLITGIKIVLEGRLKPHSTITSIENYREKSYHPGTVFWFGANRFIVLHSYCITIMSDNKLHLFGDMSEYNQGTFKRLFGVSFNDSDVTKITY